MNPWPRLYSRTKIPGWQLGRAGRCEKRMDEVRIEKQGLVASRRRLGQRHSRLRLRFSVQSGRSGASLQVQGGRQPLTGTTVNGVQGSQGVGAAPVPGKQRAQVLKQRIRRPGPTRVPIFWSRLIRALDPSPPKRARRRNGDGSGRCTLKFFCSSVQSLVEDLNVSSHSDSPSPMDR